MNDDGEIKAKWNIFFISYDSLVSTSSLYFLLIANIFKMNIEWVLPFQEKCGIMKNYCIFWIVFMVLFIIGFLKTLFHMSAGYVIAEILFLGKFTQVLCTTSFAKYFP